MSVRESNAAPAGAREGAGAGRGLDPELALRLSFAVALGASLASLFMSEVLGYPPCALCWYQRIAMYPLALIFFVALWAEDRGWARYSTPLALAGLGLAGYHNLLYYGVIPEAIAPCTAGASCTERQLELLGFITIPLLSLVSFAGLAALSAAAWRSAPGRDGERRTR